MPTFGDNNISVYLWLIFLALSHILKKGIDATGVTARKDDITARPFAYW